MSQKHIIIADDDKESCEELTEALEDRGYKVQSVHRGEDAVERILKTKFDVVLMDLKMPGIGGFEAFKKIEKINSDLPVIIITGSLPSEVSSQLKKMSFYRIFYKPFDVESLIQEIEKVLKEENAHG